MHFEEDNFEFNLMLKQKGFSYFLLLITFYLANLKRILKVMDPTVINSHHKMYENWQHRELIKMFLSSSLKIYVTADI